MNQCDCFSSTIPPLLLLICSGDQAQRQKALGQQGKALNDLLPSVLPLRDLPTGFSRCVAVSLEMATAIQPPNELPMPPVQPLDQQMLAGPTRLLA